MLQSIPMTLQLYYLFTKISIFSTYRELVLIPTFKDEKSPLNLEDKLLKEVKFLFNTLFLFFSLNVLYIF